MRTTLPLLVLAGLLSLCPAAQAQTDLQKSLGDLDLAPHWIYDDLPKALAEARATGKPVLVVLRCVPCPPGSTLDGQVMKPDPELEKLEKQFVCVRVVKTQGLDLNVFQYDYDQSWCAMFLNADLTVYGRYGTRSASGPKSDNHLSLTAFRKTLERVLALHKGYPGNKGLLAGKVGKAAEYRYPEEIPGLQDRAKVATTKKNCIHCHMVREYTLRAKWQEKKLTLDDLRVYPMPNNLGLIMDFDDGLLVKKVTPDSAAAQAGLAAGDTLATLNGQALTSLADIQWVLHTAPVEGKLAVKLRRGDKTLDVTVALSGDWKESDISWRASSWYGLRQGLQVQPLGAAEKKKRGLAEDAPALVVVGLFGKGGPLLQKAGLRKGDVIVQVDGKAAPATESLFLIDLRLNHGPGDSVRLTVLRGDKKEELTIPMW